MCLSVVTPTDNFMEEEALKGKIFIHLISEMGRLVSTCNYAGIPYTLVKLAICYRSLHFGY